MNTAVRPSEVPAPSDDALAFHAALPAYRPTPVRELPALAAELRIGAVAIKDESNRFGLPAFKVLGASWAVERALSARPDVHTLVAASEPGRARSRSRTWARAARPAGSSTATPLFSPRPPRIATSTSWSFPSGSAHWLPPPRASAQAGVAVIGVEPVTAACLTAALSAGRPIEVPTPGTAMTGLDCAVVSAIAWPSLRAGILGTVTVDDSEARAAMRELAEAGLAIGDCGAAPLAALRALVRERDCADLRDEIGFGRATRVLLIATEGPTDPDSYREAVG